MVVSVVTRSSPRKKDKFSVGDLIIDRTHTFVYMVVSASNAHPIRGKGPKGYHGVLMHRFRKVDSDGDPTPEIGSHHDRLGENYFKLYEGAIELSN